VSEPFTTRTTLWLWTTDKAPASWHFMTISGEVADAIRLSAVMTYGSRRGFGSVKVIATIGDTRWSTSLFPHKESGGWLLPVKASVRKAEALVVGDEISVTLEI
jgi:Domain of unknown function (DUF1905)